MNEWKQISEAPHDKVLIVARRAIPPAPPTEAEPSGQNFVWPPKARIVTYNMATEAWIDFATGGQIEFVPEFFKVLENLPLGVWTTQPRKLSVWDRLSNWLLGK